jgi:hypothetical protein
MRLMPLSLSLRFPAFDFHSHLLRRDGIRLRAG